MIKIICQHCSKEFETEQWRININKGKYCSKTCFNIAKRKKIGVEVDGKWFTIYKGNYYEHHSKNGILYLHRYIWEKHNGLIPEGMCIHHKDCNKHNNLLDNLELIQKNEHSIKHIRQRFKEDYEAEIEKLKKASHAALSWHQSKEGRQWHSDRAKKYWNRRKADQITGY
jgi:hypothetical protein